jgi:multisubunit Na+/H+ antiporter MnhE subunit
MEKLRGSDAVLKSVSAPLIILAAALMGIWVLLVGGFHRDEMIVGAACVIAASAMLRLVASVRQQHLHFTLRDILCGWRLPWYAAHDVWIVTHVLFRDLYFAENPRSVYRVCGFKTSKRDPGDVARRVLVTSYTSATPNVIVIGVDFAQSRLLFHQLEPRPVSETMRTLGAQR